jgi:hypothetical protein
MPAGEIILVAYGEENVVLSNEPQITFFKIVYRRYTNFSMETTKTDFIYQTKFGKRYSVEIAKIGDLIHKMWLVLELPEIPVVYDLYNNVDRKIKFKWTQKLAYAIIEYIEIEIGGQSIHRLWGEWLAVLDEINWNNFNSSLDEYIGNTIDLTTYKYLDKNFNSSTLYVPLFFWFCNNSGSALPLLCLEYSIIRLNVQIRDFESCGIFSPSHFIPIQKYFGNGILGEPLIQYSNQGIAWAEFDSLDVGTFDATTLDVQTYFLYYRKISDNSFITSSNFDSDILSLVTNTANNNYYNYIIFGLYSKSIYIPVFSDATDPTTINIEKKYNFIMPSNLVFKNMYLLSNYIYIDREERTKFYQNKHQYILEQIYYSDPRFLTNINNKVNLEIINPCKYFVFMGQVKYFLNYNVNYLFNYNTYFFDTTVTTGKILGNPIYTFKNSPVINSAYYSFNSNPAIQPFDFNFYSVLNPFLYFPMAKNNEGFGMVSFSLYPNAFQPSGSCNMSNFSSFEINVSLNPIDIDYNNYIFKCFAVTYNYLKIANGVAAPLFNSTF